MNTEAQRKSNRDYAARKRAAWKKQGLCIDCGGTPSKGFVKCDTCRDKSKVLYRRRIRQGVCTTCRNPTEDGKVVCQACRMKEKERYTKRKGAGLCHKCSAPAREGSVLCDICAEKASRRHAELVNVVHFVLTEGLMSCTHCGSSLVLQVEHLMGNGTKHRNSTAATKYNREVLACPIIYTTLCADCNFFERLHGRLPTNEEREQKIKEMSEALK